LKKEKTKDDQFAGFAAPNFADFSSAIHVEPDSKSHE
jgi:hypothetical protein